MRAVEEKQLGGRSARWANVPNAVSFARILLAPVVALAILRGHHGVALVLFAIAALTDFLDGYLARASHAATLTGQYLDPVADKILLSVVYIALGFAALVPWWFVALAFGRDLALLSASAIAMKVSRYNNYQPTIWGKISTFLQILAAIGALALPVRIARDLVLAAAAATVWSAVHYTWRGVRFFIGFRRPGQ